MSLITIATIDDVEMLCVPKTLTIHYAEILKQVKEGTLTIKDAGVVFDPVTISAAVATASTAFNGIKRHLKRRDP